MQCIFFVLKGCKPKHTLNVCMQVQCIFFVLKACEPKNRHAKYNLYSSFLKRASPNTPLDEPGIFTHFCPRAKLLHGWGNLRSFRVKLLRANRTSGETIQFLLNWKVVYSSICFSLGLRKPLDTVEYLFFVFKECSCCNMAQSGRCSFLS